MSQGRIIFHIDFDYFFAQCEELRDPALRGRPVVVCVYSGRGQESGAVSTANYEARRYGAKSGIPISLARRRLDGVKDAMFLPTDPGYYAEVSERAMAIIEGRADVFEYVGKDEAYLDVTASTGGDWKAAEHLAQKLKNEIRGQVRLSCSVGASPNKLVSKIASDYRKPDGLTLVPPGQVEAFMEKISIREIPGIGGKTEKAFEQRGLKTVKDLKKLDVFELGRMLGRRSGTYVYNAARGEDDEPVSPRAPTQQYGRIVTLSQDTAEHAALLPDLRRICAEVCAAASEDGRMFRSVGIQLVRQDMSNTTRSRMLRSPTGSLEALQGAAEALLEEALENQTPVRRLGVRVAELIEARGQRDITSYFGPRPS